VVTESQVVLWFPIRRGKVAVWVFPVEVEEWE
jgi:hypothetical protein